MTHIVKFAQNEQLTVDDMNDIGQASRDIFDFLITDAVDDTLKFAGFPITTASATQISVGAGRLYAGGIMYSNEDAGGVSVPLQTYLCAVANNTKVVSIVAVGSSSDTNAVPRTFLTNAATGTTEANVVNTQNQRYATISAVPGSEAPSPQPPPLASNQCEIARIVVNTTGIVSVTFVEANRISSVTELDVRADALEAWKAQTGARLDTLASDIANLANSIQGLPSPAIFQQIVNGLAQVEAKANTPTNAINFHFDNLLTYADSASDNTVGSWYCNVQEGIRFPWAAQAFAPITLLNPLEPKVKAGSGTGLMLPDYTEAARIDTMGSDGSISLAQYQYQNVSAVQKSISRQAINFGTSFTVCVNSAFWQSGSYDPATGIFTRNGETYQVAYTGDTYGGMKHQIVRLTQYWYTTSTDTYTDYVTTTVSVNGSIKSQTFLNSQAGWLTSIELAFTQIAADGDVTVLLTETANGAPNFASVLATSKVTAANLKLYPTTTKFAVTPTYLDPGSRYGLVIVTPGNHFVSYIEGNKYAQGSLFDSTDGVWSQGDLTKDLAFRANFAKFTSTLCQVEFNALQLQNGMTDISLIYGAKVPDGCQLFFEVMVNGVWSPMQSYGTGTNPLSGLPPLVRWRANFVGTTDLMPGMDMTQTQTLVSRPATTLQHWTSAINIGAASQNIRVQVTVDAFDPANHTVGCTLMSGSNTYTPSTTSTAPDPLGSPKRFIKTYTFALGATITSFRIGINGTTTAATNVFHVESRFDYES